MKTNKYFYIDCSNTIYIVENGIDLFNVISDKIKDNLNDENFKKFILNLPVDLITDCCKISKILNYNLGVFIQKFLNKIVGVKL